MQHYLHALGSRHLHAINASRVVKRDKTEILNSEHAVFATVTEISNADVEKSLTSTL